MSEYDPKLPWTCKKVFSRIKNRNIYWIEDSEENVVVLDVGPLDGPFIVQVMNSHNGLVDALKRIANLGANPITRHGCVTRTDFMRHCDKMWRIALEEIRKLETKECK